MADTKLANLTALTAPSGDDLLYVVDDPAGTPADRKLALDNLFTRGTVTADSPIVNAAQTWNNAAVTFTGLKLNVTSTASAAGSLLIDLQVGGTSQFRVRKDGVAYVGAGTASVPSLNLNADNTGLYSLATAQLGITCGSSISARFSTAGLGLPSTKSVSWADDATFSSTIDLYLTRRAAANIRLGAADAAAPVAQTLSVQSVVAGTSNTAGANLTITGSQGTGTGAGGSIIFQVAPAGSSGTAQNALVSALTINSAQVFTFGSGSAATLNGTTGAITTGGTIQSNADIRVQNDVILARDAANTLALRNSTNAQTFNIYNTYTDASNYERAEHFWSSNVAGIALTNAGTGSARSSFRFVGGSTGDFQVAASSDTNTAINFRHSSSPSVSGSSVSYVGRISGHRGFFDGGGAATLVIPSGATDRWAFFGTTSSFPALKRSSTVLQSRLADDSDFAPLQGQLRTHNAYTAGAPTATGYLVLYDSNGTAYKVPAEAV